VFVCVCAGELCNWTCFDKNDLATPEIVSLLNSVSPGDAVAALKTVSPRVCMYVRIYGCMYVYMCVYTDVCMYTCACVYVF
jgi:hypothetical protein